MKSKKAGGNKVVRHYWMLNSEAEIEAIALAELGRSNRRILHSTGLKDQSVSYILAKAKRLEGMEKYHTYRSSWRDGTSMLAKRIEEKILPGLKQDVLERVPKLITHPAPKVAPGIDKLDPRVPTGR